MVWKRKEMGCGLEPSAGTATAFDMGGGGTHTTHISRQRRVPGQNSSAGFFVLIPTCARHFREALGKDVPRCVRHRWELLCVDQTTGLVSPVLRNIKNTSRSMVESMRMKARIEQFLRVLSSIRGGEARNHRELRSELGKQSQTAASESRQ